MNKVILKTIRRIHENSFCTFNSNIVRCRLPNTAQTLANQDDQTTIPQLKPPANVAAMLVDGAEEKPYHIPMV
jgi:hypothetical protein